MRPTFFVVAAVFSALTAAAQPQPSPVTQQVSLAEGEKKIENVRVR